ncbi:Sir2 family NAD-dependent protein deacetylase [Nocardioides sp.]|uniref:Sir2 family NAD-dependent protein deacetylase n=1 Tax=Nocardioides sp. TaxID=35761 RepID=UPI003512B68D
MPSRPAPHAAVTTPSLRLPDTAPRPPDPPDGAAWREALDLLAARPLVLLTGAGVSTDSGIPDYRGPQAPVRAPMTFQEFVSGPGAQRRYWARSHLGWGRMGHAVPNDGHRAAARLGADLLVTQNVDGLHEAAGAPRVVALHGRIADVVCLDCRTRSSRALLQERMTALNPDFLAGGEALETRPDGDVDLDDDAVVARFVVPDCEVCGGVLKPDVVFFGENVPRPRVARCTEAVDRLPDRDGALLVAGSSLTVMSGLRFVRRAAKAGTPVVILNRGVTRGDPLATVRLEAGTSEFLTALADARAARG